ncbi:MAG: YggT family protein [Candidatus Syntrophonatronum acetioxidans]|uniref:YggT family protein n=1 Tax=Candidatus Syntrophonatronum acetioxidans TaxID=1795816 RepID=A0A424Y9W7_9FIRM|nr:MAG: YggT family protein [Candidatus Syntrophonatronum acetioxidans]
MLVFVKNLINVAFNVLYYLLIARVILSFFAANPYGNPFLAKVKSVIFNITEPLLAPLRKIIPPVNMGGGYLDLSPLIALIVLSILRSVLLSIL